MSESKHTPIPWHYQPQPKGTLLPAKVFGPRHADGGDYAALCELQDTEDARFIVMSCNSYDALLAACKAWEKASMVTGTEKAILANEAFRLTEAAIALAQKEG